MLAGLAACALLATGPAAAQSAADEADVHAPDGVLETALITTVHDARENAFEPLLFTEKVYIPITDQSFRELSEAQRVGGTALAQVRVQLKTYRTSDDGPVTALFFTSESAIIRSLGDRPRIGLVGRNALMLLPPDVPLEIQDGAGHRAIFTADEVKVLLAASATAAP